MQQVSSAFKDSKKHYEILDGLRGIAAIMVVAFHILEVFSGGDHAKMLINHAYLAVDFFFLLSGFVIGYAYDDRWTRMSLKDFFKRRLIRLHPMIIAGMVVGAITFYFQDGAYFPMIGEVPVGRMLLMMLIGFTLLPVPPSMDIRGWIEMHPLNGPAWTLFFEYVGNLLYALFIRKLPNTILALLVLVAAVALIHLGMTSPAGDIIGGWSLEPEQLRIGFTRLLYPFLAGLLMSRVVTPGKMKHAFLWSSILLIVFLSIPRVGDSVHPWMNGLYDAITVIVIFPVIVYVGASGGVEGKFETVNKFLGDISYPIYITHYPLVYVFMAWTARNNVTLTSESGVSTTVLVLVASSVFLASVALAYACVKLYDEPVRRWLTSRFLPSKS